MSYIAFLGFGALFGILILVIFGILQWLGIPAGNLVDWLIGITSFWWLLIIATIPWNIYFYAKEVITEAAISQEKEIPVDEQQLSYLKQVARWSISGAIALHVISALSLYILAATGISAVGYVSSGATLLLTGLRPAIRGYQYIAMKLARIRQQINYPREDILELRQRFITLEEKVKILQDDLDLHNPYSWATNTEQKLQKYSQELAYFKASFEQFQAKNQVEHEQLSRSAQNAVAQLTEDSQFLGHVREIIRFIKSA